MEEQFNINEIVVIEQMPKLLEKLDLLGEMVDKKLEGVLDIQCTEENKQEVKKTRTEINNTLKALEDKRKEIKSAINEPYEIFNKKYEETTKIKLKNASDELAKKIDEIENAQKIEKENELKDYFEEYREFHHLEKIVKFEDVGLNITLSASMKSLKDQIENFCVKVSNDLVAISNDENKEEILIEYKKNGFGLSKAIVDAKERIRQLNEIKNQMDESKEMIEQEQQVVDKVEELLAPVVVEEETMTITFTITDTKENIIKVREFMKEEGIKYE